MRIVLDLGAVQGELGFCEAGKCSLAFAKSIVKNKAEHEVIVILSDIISHNINEIRLEFDGILPFENIKVWRGLQKNTSLPEDCVNRKLANEILRESYIASLKPDIVHIFSIFNGVDFEVPSSIGKFYKGIKTSVTFYDVIPFIYPEKCLNNEIYKKFYPEKCDNLKRAELLFSTSESSHLEAIDYMKIPEAKVVNVSFVVDEELKELSLKQAKSFSGDKSAKVALNEMEKVYSVSQHEEINIRSVSEMLVKNIDFSYGDVDLGKLSECLVSNFNEKSEKPTIFIDISELVKNDGESGVQRVTKNILKELLKMNGRDFYVEPVYTFDEGLQGYRYAKNYIAKLSNDKIKHKEFLIDVQDGDIFLGLDLCHIPVINGINSLQSLRNKGVKVYFVIYDLLPITLSSFFHDRVPSLHDSWLWAISEFDGAISISNSVRLDFLNWQHSKGIKTHSNFINSFFHLSGDIANAFSSKGFPSDADEILAKLKSKVTILMVSTLEPRKAHKATFDAVKKLWDSGYDFNFVMVGKQGWKIEEFVSEIQRDSEYEKRLIWLHGVSDEYLAEIYKSSSVVIMSSYGEGFGLAVIEAAKYGKPLILRDIPVFREIAENNAFYFKDDGDISNVIKEWIKLFNEGKHPTAEGIKRITWKETTEMLLKCLPISRPHT